MLFDLAFIDGRRSLGPFCYYYNSIQYCSPRASICPKLYPKQNCIFIRPPGTELFPAVTEDVILCMHLLVQPVCVKTPLYHHH